MLIIGCGNRERSDDGVGILVAERLRELGIPAESRRAGDVIVIDAMVTGAPVGTVQTWEGESTLQCTSHNSSTHGFGVAEAIELAHVLDRFPPRLRVYGVEGRRFEAGAGMSPEVELAVEEVVRRIIADVSARTCGGSNIHSGISI